MHLCPANDTSVHQSTSLCKPRDTSVQTRTPTHTHQKTPLYVPLQNNRLQCVLVVPLQLWNLTHVHAMFPHTHLLTQMSSNVNIDNICAWMCMGMCADASLHVPYLRVYMCRQRHTHTGSPCCAWACSLLFLDRYDLIYDICMVHYGTN